MIACTLSNLELRNIIESAFLPWRCSCSVVDDLMTVEITDPHTERVQLRRSHIPLEHLDTSRSLCDLIMQLRNELNSPEHLHDHALAS